MSKIVNITSKEDKDQKLQDIANSLQELKDVMAEVIEAYEEELEDVKKILKEQSKNGYADRSTGCAGGCL